MCGIAGIIRFNQPISSAEIEGMTSALAHRGPDGDGIWIEDNIALGHRRLAIIDLATGKQPMSNEDGSIWVSFNGEIYNFMELRRELTEKGHLFRTHSDTEVIVHAYEQWGDDCVKRFRGMFAYGIVDKIKKRIFLARDHLGIKPLVYYFDANCFAFASEIQALRQVDGVKLDLDLQGIDQYLWLQYIPAPRSVFKQIRKLPPAHRMSVTFDGRISEQEEYWRLEFRPDNRKTEAEWLVELEAVLYDSVKAHLISDVPFGAFLSGGVDSSAIVAYMAQILDKPVKTFSIGFEEEDFNELKFAHIAAKRWGTDHHVEIVKPDALAILPELVRHYGEPFGDSSAIPTFYVCRLARQYVPMVLTGDGGDEAFGGYHSYLAWMAYLQHESVQKRPLWRKALSPLAYRLFPERYPHLAKPSPTLTNWLGFINYMSKSWRIRLWRREYKFLAKNPLEVFEREFAHTTDYSGANKVQYMDIKTYLPFDILTKVDVASMIHSLEVRTPIVDKKVMEFAATIPEAINLNNNCGGAWQGKLLLKKLLTKYYSHDFLYRYKMGFAVPIQKWFARDGSLHDELRDRLLGSSSTLKEYFEPKTISVLIKANHTGPLWLLLFFEEWLRQASCD